MLEQVLMHLNNWFLVPDGVHEGTYTIGDGGITLPFLVDGQYFRIMGSVFNDGLHRYSPEMDLKDETFGGTIWALAIPQFIVDSSETLNGINVAINELSKKISSNDFYTSESFGGYSYSKDTVSQISALNAQKSEILSQLKRAYGKPRELSFVRPTRRNYPYERPYNPDYPWR